MRLTFCVGWGEILPANYASHTLPRQGAAAPAHLVAKVDTQATGKEFPGINQVRSDSGTSGGGTVLSFSFSLRSLCGLCASAASFPRPGFTAEDAENAGFTQRTKSNALIECRGLTHLAPNGGIIKLMKKNLNLVLVFLVILLPVGVFSRDGSTGGIKGKVQVETGTPGGIAVIVRQGEREVARGVTDKNGAFVVSGLAPGRYGVTLRKPGLSVGTIEDIEVKAGKNRSLSNLVLGIDEGSIAFIKGSVFNQDDRSVPNVRIELARIQSDGTARKIDGRVTNEIGSFVFRLQPDAARYRITAKPNRGDPVSKDVEIDGAAVYRVALSIKPAGK